MLTPHEKSRPVFLRRGLRIRHGLTLIEVMVVMAIILILIGLLIVGMKQWNASAAHQTTVVRLELLRGFTADLKALGGNQFNSQWFMNPTTVGVGLDARFYGNVEPDAQGSTESLPKVVIPATFKNSRNQAIADTSETIMYRLSAISQDAKTIQGLPSNAVVANGPFASGSVPTPTNPPFPAAPTGILNFPPVILDGWGNPIIFVPSPTPIPGGTQTGLINVYVNASSTPNPVPITSPDGLPFWASAGPDGDFIRGDDNIYSFNPQ